VPANHSAYFSGYYEVDSLNNFILQPLGTHDDLKITLTPVSLFRPGFDAHYNINYKNIGTTSLSGTVVFYLDANISFVSATVTPAFISTDSVTWNTTLLDPFDDGNILITVNVSTGAAIGSMINSTAKIEPVAGDATPANNTASWEVTVTGSIDPNDILVSRKIIYDTELPSSPHLEYLIRFQNTGTDTAFNVKVLNPVSPKLNVSSIDFIGSSHDIEINYNNSTRQFWFEFHNIYLPDSNVNEPASHGYIHYSIPVDQSLVVGDSILNKAYIYFDFNDPVETNTAKTTIDLFVSSNESVINNSKVILFPNPTKGETTLEFYLQKSSMVALDIFNPLGQKIKYVKENKAEGKNEIIISTSLFPKGTYFIRFSIDNEVVMKKLIKM